MNRTASRSRSLPWLALVLAAVSPAQAKAEQRAQDPAVAALMEAVRKAEGEVRTLAMVVETQGSYPGGLRFETRGTLHVLRGEHPATRSSIEFRFGNGLEGKSESLSNEKGVLLFESNPAFGDVHLRIDGETMADLAWAGSVLERDDLVPGRDPRAFSPLGSRLVEQLARDYDLKVLSHRMREGLMGTWVGGDRDRRLQADPDPELQLADRVEFFVDDIDHVVREVVHLLDGQKDPVQRISVRSIVVNGPIDAGVFALDVPGAKPLAIQQHEPSWAPLEKLLRKAEEKAKTLRPSRRGAAGEQKKAGPEGGEAGKI
ncbi:MAG: hypothetical protein Fur0037_25110 [Planctomycetota bacterium]